MVKGVSKMNIMQKNDSIKTNNVIPLHLNEYTKYCQVRIEITYNIIVLKLTSYDLITVDKQGLII